MENEELLNSDATPEVSSEPQETVDNTPAPAAQAAEATNKQPSQEESNVPFHEHPRFKELVDQKNQFSTKASELERQVQEMQARLQSFSTNKTDAQKKEDALLSRLKSIDPEFGERFAEVDGLRDQIKQFKEWQQNFEREKVRTEAFNTLNQLHEQNKVAPEWRDIYNSQIELAAMRNPNIGLKDLPQLYKSVHDAVNKNIESLKRQTTASYVDAKKADTKAPTAAPKGKAVSPVKSGEYSKDPGKARQEMVSKILKEARASKDV